MLDFNDTKTAFARKSDGEMRNALMLFRMMKRPGLVKAGKRACGAAARLHLPMGWIVKPTLYRQFVGGETLEECGPTVDGLERAGVKAALDYSAESEQTPVGIEAVFAETERSIEYAARNKNVAYAVFKPSTLTTDTLLAKASEHPETLTAAERAGFDAFAARFDALCALAHRHGVRILVDAEDVRFQDAVDRLTEEAMHRYNGGRAIVFATLQMYRCDRMPYLRRLYEDARQADYVAGVKFVRGAYMEEERARAAAMGYPDPICPTKEATDANFDEGVAFAVEHIDRMEIFMGSHNETSNYRLARLIDEKGLERNDRRIFFAQLHGMGDHISFNLAAAGYNVVKYVPYARVRDVLPYLIRRAEENTSMAGQTTRELDVLRAEMKRRREARRER